MTKNVKLFGMIMFWGGAIIVFGTHIALLAQYVSMGVPHALTNIIAGIAVVIGYVLK